MARVEIEKAYRGKRVFVTGADGFIGSHLAERLVSAGAEVTALALYNAFGRYGWLDELADDVRAALRLELGDVRDGAAMRRLVDGHDTVFHLAALIGIPYSYAATQSYVDVNVHGTLNMLEAARAADVGRFVHTSTSEVYGSAQTKPITEEHPLHAQSPYAASKVGADQMAAAFALSFDMPVVILRPFNTFGPRQSERAVIPTAIRQMLDPACDEVRLGDLNPTRDFTFITDTVGAFLAIGSGPDVPHGVAHNSGTGVETSIEDVVRHLGKITGNNKPIVEESARMRPTQSEVRALIADATRLRAASGWKPEVELQVGLERTVAWWQERVAAGKLRREANYSV